MNGRRGNCAPMPTKSDRGNLRQRVPVVLVRECDRRSRVCWPLPKRADVGTTCARLQGPPHMASYSGRSIQAGPGPMVQRGQTWPAPSLTTNASLAMRGALWNLSCLTFDMSGGWKRAQPAGNRPLDGRVRDQSPLTHRTFTSGVMSGVRRLRSTSLQSSWSRAEAPGSRES